MHCPLPSILYDFDCPNRQYKLVGNIPAFLTVRWVNLRCFGGLCFVPSEDNIGTFSVTGSHPYCPLPLLLSTSQMRPRDVVMQAQQRLLWEPQPHVYHPWGCSGGVDSCWGPGCNDCLLKQKASAVPVPQTATQLSSKNSRQSSCSAEET